MTDPANVERLIGEFRTRWSIYGPQEEAAWRELFGRHEDIDLRAAMHRLGIAYGGKPAVKPQADRFEQVILEEQGKRLQTPKQSYIHDCPVCKHGWYLVPMFRTHDNNGRVAKHVGVGPAGERSYPVAIPCHVCGAGIDKPQPERDIIAAAIDWLKDAIPAAIDRCPPACSPSFALIEYTRSCCDPRLQAAS